MELRRIAVTNKSSNYKEVKDLMCYSQKNKSDFKEVLICFVERKSKEYLNRHGA